LFVRQSKIHQAGRYENPSADHMLNSLWSFLRSTILVATNSTRLCPNRYSRHHKVDAVAECNCEIVAETTQERLVLAILLLINAFMFLAEFVAGVFAESMGLVADSLDMLANAAVKGSPIAGHPCPGSIRAVASLTTSKAAMPAAVPPK
jgi:hypothetical protein